MCWKKIRCYWSQILRLNKMKSSPLVVVYASLLHILWGGLLLLDAAAFNTNPIGFFGAFMSRISTALLFLGVGVFTLFYCKLKNNMYQFMMFIPQQILLLLTSFSGIFSAIKGSYVDGVIRSGVFILTDQLPIILLSLVYGFDIYNTFMRSHK